MKIRYVEREREKKCERKVVNQVCYGSSCTTASTPHSYGKSARVILRAHVVVVAADVFIQPTVRLRRPAAAGTTTSRLYTCNAMSLRSQLSPTTHTMLKLELLVAPRYIRCTFCERMCLRFLSRKLLC